MLKPFPQRKDIWKAIPKSTLIGLLMSMPDGTWVETCDVGNLIVRDAAGESIGFVDIAFESYEPFRLTKKEDHDEDA